MTHAHLPSPANRVDLVIEEGMEWYHTEAVYYIDPASTMPDLSTWTATFVVWPNGDTTATPVIELETGSGITLGVAGAGEVETALDGAASVGAVSVVVDDGAGIVGGDHIVIDLEDGSHFVTTATNTPTIDVVTLALPLPLGADNDAVVRRYAPTHMVHNIQVHIAGAVTSTYEPWGIGLYNLDLIDPFGRPVHRFAGTCCLSRGSDHA